MTIAIWLLIGGVLGFLLGLNHSEGATFVANYRRMDIENKELQAKVNKYKVVVKDLVENNKALVKELDSMRQEITK